MEEIERFRVFPPGEPPTDEEEAAEESAAFCAILQALSA